MDAVSPVKLGGARMLETCSLPLSRSPYPVRRPAISETIGKSLATAVHPKREWNGLVAEVLELYGPGRYVARLKSDRPALVVVLEEIGGHIDVRLDRGRADGFEGASKYTGSLNLIPRDVAAWECANLRYGKRILFQFDLNRLSKALATDLSHANFSERLGFSDARVSQLSAFLAAECTERNTLGQLYGDGLAIALCVALTKRQPAATQTARGGLPPHLLRRVMDYIEQNWDQPIELRNLAAITGLSQSQFGRMFKISTGMPPHRWHLDVRIRRARELLLKDGSCATDVAIATGFADQSHFTKTFRKLVGVSPRAWQRERMA
jgi:AraC family transcriptional regulator